ncbi:aldo/keto reductase [Enterococcus sp. AZ109]|uniref:aldo/keto reductase n=1 Tax=Enterococcus sp. AZ109 TaxID=2774634 RepID=UPI003F1EB8F8
MQKNTLFLPEIGFGVYQIVNQEECIRSVKAALDSGYRMIDTAAAYGNEVAVGKAIRQSGIDRNEINVTSKIWVSDYGYEKTQKAIDKSLRKLKMETIDLLLLHQPIGDYLGSWRALEEAVVGGKVKGIGVSNFTISQLQEVIDRGNILPAVNQVECHPYHAQKELKAFIDQQGIRLEAWYPIGHGNKKLLNEPLFLELGKKYGKSVVQVILRWHYQSKNIAIPKSTNPEHIKANLAIFDFELTNDEMQKIGTLDKNQPFFKTNPVMNFFMKRMKIPE